MEYEKYFFLTQFVGTTLSYFFILYQFQDSEENI